MNGVLNLLNQFSSIVLVSIIMIQLYENNDKIENKSWRIAANTFPAIALAIIIILTGYHK